MFTPPPSPGIPPNNTPPTTAPNVNAKRRIGRRTRWTVVLVPLALIFITASTRYLTHPAAFDWLSSSEISYFDKRADTPAFATLSGSAQSSAPPPAPTGPPSQQTVPVVPTSPTLPAPFPQPFDTALSQNFSTISCFNFFQNMTNTVPFRSCRAFSLLLQSSNAFIGAQSDLSRLNTLVWGTCNTEPTADACAANMAWFSANLASACAIDLKDRNSMAVNTQTALDAYGVMRSAGCLIDPTTNSYCYLNAVHNSNPSDTFFYSLPLGIRVPNNTIASCSACTKSLMTLYYTAVGNSSTTPALAHLKEAYPNAAKIAVADCGTSYATLATAHSGAESLRLRLWPGILLLVGIASAMAALP
ncbi:hypothetical protein MIND_00437700 [Mycena indigotica]|uniref:DUF7729 domain-containing protein n=1 Tax=Mycena indigotica TaxID=2126181 RepID=A0A8H6SWL1_9AGAR|nr:uncharacterized protein MIND_00437700 [Mycena indigotica]KAF7306465.1 hypothetical protein MIND_00437700 [Mycena indigotica]